MKLSQQRNTFRAMFHSRLAAYEDAIRGMFDAETTVDREAQFVLCHELFAMIALTQSFHIITATDAARFEQDIRQATARANAQLLLDLSDTREPH